MRNVSFTSKAFEEYNEWFEENQSIMERIKTLIRDIDRDPFKGLGKPPSLPHPKLPLPLLTLPLLFRKLLIDFIQFFNR